MILCLLLSKRSVHNENCRNGRMPFKYKLFPFADRVLDTRTENCRSALEDSNQQTQSQCFEKNS